METIGSVLRFACVGVTIVVVVFLVLLALPKSKLRSVVLEVMGWTGAAGSAVAVVSPIDVVPDFVPVLGQMDDVAYIMIGIVSAILAYLQRKARQLES